MNSESQTQKRILEQRARDRGLVFTLVEMMEPPLGAEYRRTADDLRKDGWIITVEQNRKEPSKNLWKFIPPGERDEPKDIKQKYREEYAELCKKYAAYKTVEEKVAILRQCRDEYSKNPRQRQAIEQQIA